MSELRTPEQIAQEIQDSNLHAVASKAGVNYQRLIKAMKAGTDLDFFFTYKEIKSLNAYLDQRSNYHV